MDDRRPAPAPLDGADAGISEVLHRLRTPLTAAKGWTQIARRQASAGAPAVDLLPALDRAVEAMTKMASELDALASRSQPQASADAPGLRRHVEPVKPPESDI